MKIIMSAVFFFCSFQVLAKTVQFAVNLKLKKDNQTRESTAKINVKMGSEFSIEREDIRATFVATKLDPQKSPVQVKGDAVWVKAKVYQKSSKGEKIVGRPEAIVLMGTEAIFTMEEPGGFLEIKLRPSYL